MHACMLSSWLSSPSLPPCQAKEPQGARPPASTSPGHVPPASPAASLRAARPPAPKRAAKRDAGQDLQGLTLLGEALVKGPVLVEGP